VTANIAAKLRSTGILTVQKLYKTPLDELLEIEGVGPKTAEKLKESAIETMDELNKALEELLEKERAEEAVKEELFDETDFAPEEKEEEEPGLTEEQLFGDLAGPSGDEEEDEDTGDDEEDGEEDEDTGDDEEDGEEEEENDAEQEAPAEDIEDTESEEPGGEDSGPGKKE
jgi:hypothetical protein